MTPNPGSDSFHDPIEAALAGRSPAPLPEPWLPEAVGLGWDDYGEALEEAHGELHGSVDRSDLAAAVEAIVGPTSGTTPGAAALLGVAPGPFDTETLDGLPWVVALGTCAIARNGAVAVDASVAPARLQLLLPESLLLLVPFDSLVDDLPQLYARLDPATLATGYLTLISGPSKTADIEQTLVKGAHGPRRLVVLPFRE